MRPGVVGVKVRIAEAVIDDLGHQRVIAGVDVADDVGDLVEGGIDVSEVIALGRVGAATSERPARAGTTARLDNIVDIRPSVARATVVIRCLCVDQIGVDEVAELAADGSQVADGEHRVAANILLQRQVVLHRLRVLEVLVEVLDTWRRQRGWREGRRLDAGKLRPSLGVAEANGNLAGRRPSGGVRRQQDVIDEAAIVHAEAAADDSLAFAVWIVGEADARSEVVFIAGPVRHLRKRYILADRLQKIAIWRWIVLVVVAETEVQSEPGCGLPVVLNEEAVVDGGYIEGSLPEVLSISGIAGQRPHIEFGGTGAACAGGLSHVGKEISEILIGVITVRREAGQSKAVDQVVVVHDVATELEAVLAMDPGERIGDLPFALIGEGLSEGVVLR